MSDHPDPELGQSNVKDDSKTNESSAGVSADSFFAKKTADGTVETSNNESTESPFAPDLPPAGAVCLTKVVRPVADERSTVGLIHPDTGEIAEASEVETELPAIGPVALESVVESTVETALPDTAADSGGPPDLNDEKLEEPPEPERRPGSFFEDEKEMSLTEHLEEMRYRILVSLAAWVAGSVAVYNFAPKLLAFTRPLLGKAKLIFTSPMEGFMTYLKVALIGGLFVAGPVLVYQILMFVLPGLKPSEKKWMLALLPFSVLLFFAGAAFSYFAVLPVTLQFFLSFATEDLEATIKLDDYLSFLINMIGLCGLTFQLPLVMLFGALLGIVKSRFLRSQRRVAYFVGFLLAAVATPTPDMVTMTIVALPILVLFEISIILLRIIGK